MRQKSFHILAISYFLAFSLLPLILGAGYAFLYSLGLAGVLSKGFTLEHWQAAFSDSHIRLSFLYTFYIAFVSLFLSVGLALVAVIRGRKAFQRGLLSYLIYLPLGLPAIVTAFFVFQLLGQSAWLSRLSWHLGMTSSIQAFPELVQDSWGIGIIFAHVMVATPFFSILFLNLYESERLEELAGIAQSLGAASSDIHRRISLPILLQTARPSIVLYFVFLFGSYEVPLLLGQQSPQMVSIFILNKLQKFNLADLPMGYVVALGYMVAVLAVVRWGGVSGKRRMKSEE